MPRTAGEASHSDRQSFPTRLGYRSRRRHDEADRPLPTRRTRPHAPHTPGSPTLVCAARGNRGIRTARGSRTGRETRARLRRPGRRRTARHQRPGAPVRLRPGTPAARHSVDRPCDRPGPARPRPRLAHLPVARAADEHRGLSGDPVHRRQRGLLGPDPPRSEPVRVGGRQAGPGPVPDPGRLRPLSGVGVRRSRTAGAAGRTGRDAPGTRGPAATSRPPTRPTSTCPRQPRTNPSCCAASASTSSTTRPC